ncbi:hypothetical protein LTR08_006118 [Meristemomyces frigidus]|nr:hypothetical protein LTR08_006118 [Meristemomyces frigidus]
MAKRKAAREHASAATRRKKQQGSPEATPSAYRPAEDECPLLELPIELMIYILEEMLSSKDLLQVRGTCKTLEKLATPIAAGQYFVERNYMLSDRSSMEALRQLTERPAIAKAMRYINFTNGVANTSGKITGDEKPLTRGQLRAVQLEQEMVRQEEKVFRAGDDIKCLVMIFRNLMKAESTPSICCAGSRFGQVKAYVPEAMANR